MHGAVISLLLALGPAADPAPGTVTATDLLRPAPDAPAVLPALDPEGELRELRKRLDELEARLGKSGDGDKPAKDGAEKESPAETVVGRRRLEWEWNDGAWAQTADRAFRFHIGGRGQIDASWYRAPESVQAGLSPTLTDGVAIRRFRLEADATVFTHIDLALQADFARSTDLQSSSEDPSPNVYITDAWIAFRDLPLLDTVR